MISKIAANNHVVSPSSEDSPHSNTPTSSDLVETTTKTCSYENIYHVVDRSDVTHMSDVTQIESSVDTDVTTTSSGEFRVNGTLVRRRVSSSEPPAVDDKDTFALTVNGNGNGASPTITKVVQSFDNELSVNDPTSSNHEGESIGEKRGETRADWWVLVCAFLFNVHTGFNFSTYSVLYVPLTELFGSTRAAVGWIQSIEFALGNVLGLLVSYPLSVYGCRRTALVGSVLVCVGGILSCFAPNLALMYLLKGVIPGVGLSMCILANAVIIQQRFDAHRGLATGLSVIGFSLGNVVCPPLVEFLLNRYSIRGTLAILGAIQAQRIPLALQLRTPKRFLKLARQEKFSTEDETSSATRCRTSVCCEKLTNYLHRSLDFKLLTNTSFALFCLASVLQKFIVHGYIPHTVNWVMAAGLPRQVGVWAVSVTSMIALACRVVVAIISDRAWVNRLVLFAIGLLLVVPAMLPPIISPGFASTFISVVIFGVHNGFTHTLISVVIVDLLGVKNVARAYALFAFITAFATLGAIPLIGLIYDLWATYVVAFIIFACFGLMSFGLQVAVIFIEKRKLKSRRRSGNSEDFTMTS